MVNKKIKMSNMSYAEQKSYRYYKRLLNDLNLYGSHHLKDLAEKRIKVIEQLHLSRIEEAKL